MDKSNNKLQLLKVRWAIPLLLNMMLGWGTYSGQFTYSITEVFYYITVVLIFVFYLLLVFTFYIFTSQGDRTYRRVRYNDPAVDNLLEIVSNEL